jgi:hypothetical protein
MINQDILEETQEILLNVLQSLRELRKDNFDERIEFIINAFNHMQTNVITEEIIKDSNIGVNELLKKIKRNMSMFVRLSLGDVNIQNYIDRKPMLINWVSYYVKQVDTYLKNGRTL